MNNITNLWKNKPGTGDEKCNCESWKNHWIKFSGKSWPIKCSRTTCISIPELGAHLQNQNEIDLVRIVPMCDACNKKVDNFNLDFDVELVSTKCP